MSGYHTSSSIIWCLLQLPRPLYWLCQSTSCLRMHVTHSNNFFCAVHHTHTHTHIQWEFLLSRRRSLTGTHRSITLHNEQKTPMWQSKSGTFTIHNARSGKYEFCIQNGNLRSDDTYSKQDGFPHEVGFAIRAVPPARGLDGKKFGPDDQLTTNLLTMSFNGIACHVRSPEIHLPFHRIKNIQQDNNA